MINEQDYTKTEKDGVITFTPKKKEVTGERRRVNDREKFWYINPYGFIDFSHTIGVHHDNCFNCGNYYPTKEQAQAVADLRRHVYKFPALSGHVFYYNKIKWFGSPSPWYLCYSRGALPLYATKEDQQERSRLIENCLELNGYITI